MKNIIKSTLILSTILIISGWIIPQEAYVGPDDLAADPAAIREAHMDGNRVLLYFKNTTQLSNWAPGGLNDVSIWPNDGTGTRMVDGIGLLIGGKTYILDDLNPATLDTLVLDDSTAISLAEYVHEVYFLQTQYREEVDHDELNSVDWTFYPVFGYFNPGQDYPAMSDDPNSWPLEGWPSTGINKQWAGFWDGRFGKGVTYADLETYFVVNDAQDQEYLQNEWRYGGFDTIEFCGATDSYANVDSCNFYCDDSCVPTTEFAYYPRSGYTIQHDASFQAGAPWGGLGVRVEARAFQWNNPLVRDALFWEYNIANISDYNITETSFGYWVDNAIGSENADDEVGYFDDQLDLSYSWDFDGVGFAGATPGIMGFAFLESPGKGYDNLDNDLDGLIDESRDNDAGILICATCGIDDLENFLTFYDLQESDLKEHWSGDEDQDWRDSYRDENGVCSQLWDDVGLDGIGPNDINYTEPDEGECNGRPDYVEGVGGEPNFAATDVSESDMIGLTTFQLFRIDSHAENNTTKWFKNDDVMWNMLSDTVRMQYTDVPSNLVELFASGTFELSQGKTERISMAELHSFDPITGSPGGQSQNAVALFELKRTVQTIYETDYRFAQPPTAPTLTAEAGDGQVILTWGNISEFSRDPFLPDSLQLDFEGYKIYRSTDKYLRDAQIITDGFGNPMFFQPIFQCDKEDGITGFADWAPVFGTSYYLGDDSGIQHSFIDTEVQNGRTYYYAIVAYDYGLEPDNNMTSGIPPSENNAVIELDENEYVLTTGPNVAIVVPMAASAGYVFPELEIEPSNLLGTGLIEASVFAPGALVDGGEYVVTFMNETDGENYVTASGIKVLKTLDDPIVWCESDISCDEYNSSSECFTEEGCSWDDQEQFGTLEAISAIFGYELNFTFADESTASGKYVSFADKLEILLKEPENNFCTKLNFDSNDNTSYVGNWYLTSALEFDNPECVGVSGVQNNDLDFSTQIWDDNTFNFVSYSCLAVSACDNITVENECVNSAGCTWEVETLELIYDEKPPTELENVHDYRNDNLVREEVEIEAGLLCDYWALNTEQHVITDVFDGIQLTISGNVDTARIQSEYWETEANAGQGILFVNYNSRLSKIEPWDYEIIFTGIDGVYQSNVPYPANVTDENGIPILDVQNLYLNESFDFYIYNSTTQDTMAMLAYDSNNDGTFDLVGDKILVGRTGPYFYQGALVDNIWQQTNFTLSFFENPNDEVENYPEPGDKYAIIHARPFMESDSLWIYAQAPDTVSVSEHDLMMENIKVVPNPYVCTNVMEQAIFNTGYNQRRKLAFTHLPSKCTIHIYTVSGVLVDKIQVDNGMDEGSIHWDLQTNEGLEVAAGMYIYHVKSGITGKEKLGKFAVIK
jgi:hypothetical protein